MSPNDVQRKSKKKLAKVIGAVQQTIPDVKIIDTAGRNLLVANGGIVCGWDEDSLISLFNQYDEVVKVILLANKSFAFVELLTVDGAERVAAAFEAGRLAVGSQAPLYLAFLAEMPKLCTKDKFAPVPGLMLVEDFITEQMEAELTNKLLLTENIGMLKNRQVRHYGHTFVYGSNQVDKTAAAPSIPSFISDLIDRMMTMQLNAIQIRHRPDQVTVNIYEPGQGIPLHVDTHSAFEDSVISLSLGSDYLMDFRDQTRKVVSQILLPARSLLVMTGESRYVWSHGITPRKTDTLCNGQVLRRRRRISVTFRRVRNGPCDCDFPQHCDHPRNDESSASSSAAKFPPTEPEAVELERDSVHKVYQEIADHFNDTRHSQWPGVKAFLHSLPVGSLLCDVGCGNGKYLFEDNKHHLAKIGCDRCERLVDICRAKGFEVFVADGINLPLASGRFDGVLSIAVIHHFATEERRQRAISELVRILRPGGLALIYVWAFEQRRNCQNSSYLKTEVEGSDSVISSVTTGQILVHQNRTAFRAADLLVPWETAGSDSATVFYRYYHVFHENELATLCARVPTCRVVQSWYEQGNWAVVLSRQ